MEHRGPDDQAIEVVEAAGAWGMCRLAIRDPSRAAMQPLWRDGVGIIFNGEIYNTAVLTQQLEARGHRFVTTGDTEVLLCAYLEFGTAAVALLDGIFAIAIIDTKRRCGILARDYFGVKPLYYEVRDRQLRFASELGALREIGGGSRGVDDQAVLDVLRFPHVREPRTGLRGVECVPRGETIEFALDHGGVGATKREVFGFPREGNIPMPNAPDAEWLDALEEALRCSVSRQLVSDRPLGLFLSGGIDSTTVCGYASDLHSGLQAFGVATPTTTHDETEFMCEAARRLDVDLAIVPLEEADFRRTVIELSAIFGQPFGDFSAVPTRVVSEAAAREMRVVLSGDGGDELFGGYARYRWASWLDRLARVPRWVVRGLLDSRDVRLRNYGRVAERVRDADDLGEQRYNGIVALRSLRELEELVPSVKPRGLSRIPNGPSPIEAAMEADIEQYLVGDILAKVDRTTMWHSLEARVPLLGAPVASISEVMPLSIKRRGGVGKWPLKELLLRRGFPSDFVHRPKRGFSFDLSPWLRRLLAEEDFCHYLVDPPAPISRSASQRELAMFTAGRLSAHAIWTTFVTSRWLRSIGC